jgi:hypothetical protein
MKMTVHDEIFHINCYGLTLGSYDMVFRVQWLESLGPILWDFCRDTVALIRNGRQVGLHHSSSSDHDGDAGGN